MSITVSKSAPCRPISMRLQRAILSKDVDLNQIQKPNRVIHAIKKGALTACHIAAIPIALIEAITTLALGAMLLTANRLCFSYKSKVLEKASLNLFSYGYKSYLTVQTLFTTLLISKKNQFHTIPALIEHQTHAWTFLTMKGVVGNLLGYARNAGLEELMREMQNQMPTEIPYGVQDICRGIEKDLKFHLFSHPIAQQVLQIAPEFKEMLDQLDILKLRTDPEYRQDWERAIQSLERHQEQIMPMIQQIVDPLRQQYGPQLAGLAHIDTSRCSPGEKRYQAHLEALYKRALRKVYQDNSLCEALSSYYADWKGRDLLVSYDPSVVLPLAQFTQYLELKEGLQCPMRFTGDRVALGNRSETLRFARELLSSLPEQGEKELQQKLLAGAAYNGRLSQNTQSAYDAICQLAGQLHQGPLVTRVSFAPANLAQGNNPLVSENIFMGPFRAFLQEIQPR